MVPMFVDPIAPVLAAGLVVETWPFLAGLGVVAVAAAVVVVALVGRDRSRLVEQPGTPALRNAA